MTEFGSPGSSKSAPPLPRPMSQTLVVEHLKSCQRIAVEHAHQLFETFLHKLDIRLMEYGQNAKTNQEQNLFFETLREFRNNGEELGRYFCGYLGESFVKFKNRQLNTRTGEEKFQGDMLSLVEKEDLEEIIAVSSITHRAETFYAEPLWALNQRFSILNGGERVSECGNPVGPVQFCESLRKALKLLSIGTKAKIIAYKAFDKELVSQLNDIYSETNQYLADQGLLPNLRYSLGTQPSPPSPRTKEPSATSGKEPSAVSGQKPSAVGETENSADFGKQPAAESGPLFSLGVPLPVAGGLFPAPDRRMPSDQYQGHLVDAIRLLQNHVARHTESGGSAAGAASTARGGHPAVVYSNQQLVGALQHLQTEALTITRQMQGGSDNSVPLQNIVQFNSQLAARLQQSSQQEGAVKAEDMHTIDLVGMLFEYMLSDDNLPDSVKALLSYLHTPFLKIAFIDTDFFQQTEHPARLLLNSLAEAGARWVGNDGSSQYDIYAKIKAVVSRVLEEFQNDVRLFAELLFEFSAYTKKILRRQELMERRAMEKVQGEEKLREVKMRVNHEVRSRTDGRELPSAVLLLLLQPWSDYLAFVLLRYGEQSESWRHALATVDNILWSIQPKENNTEKTRQMEMHDELLDIIETGFETIGYDQAKGKKLLEALFSLQKLALQSKKAEPAPAPMRDKLESMAAEKAGRTTQFEDKATTEEETMVENLKMIEFGTWFEFEGGKRLKVAWYNSKTSHYMLVDQMGKKVAMKSGLELAREMLAGHTKVIAGSTRPFFERALENIFHSLNARAESLQPKGNVKTQENK